MQLLRQETYEDANRTQFYITNATASVHGTPNGTKCPINPSLIGFYMLKIVKLGKKGKQVLCFIEMRLDKGEQTPTLSN